MTKQNILIIDDEQDICLLLGAILRSFGHSVNFESTLKLGVENALKNSPDIIFLDLNLPDGASFSVIKSLKNLHPNIKVIVISGFDTLPEKTRCLLEGADYFVGKPFNRDTINDALRKVLFTDDVRTDKH